MTETISFNYTAIKITGCEALHIISSRQQNGSMLCLDYQQENSLLQYILQKVLVIAKFDVKAINNGTLYKYNKKDHANIKILQIQN